MKKVLAWFLAFVMAISCMGITAFAKETTIKGDTAVGYKEPVYNEDGVPASGVKEWTDGECSSYELIKNSDRTIDLKPGWYVVDGNVTVQGMIRHESGTSGDLNIILKDESTLNVTTNGIYWEDGKVNIYTVSHTDNCGQMNITSGSNDAIFADNGLIINGGKLNLTAKGYSIFALGEIIINAGTVNSTTDSTENSNIQFNTQPSPSALRMNGGILNVTGGKKLVSWCTINGSVTAYKTAEGSGIELSDPNEITDDKKGTVYHHAKIEPYKTRTISVDSTNKDTVSADKTTGKYGDNVTITVSVPTDYKLDSLTVVDTAGDTVEFIEGETAGTYTFTMPDSNVTITAKFYKPVTLYIDSEAGNDNAERTDENPTFKTIAGAMAELKSYDTIKLMSDVTEDVCIPEEISLTLDLNGYVLKGNGEDTVVDCDENAGSFTIMDSENEEAVDHYFKVDANGMWVLDTTTSTPTADYTYSTADGLEKDGKASDDIPVEGSVIAVSGGCITGGHSDNGVGGVSSVILYLQGGNIIGNSGGYVGGILLVYGNMTGGSVIGNYSETGIGGLYSLMGGIFTGGRISYNSGVVAGFDIYYASMEIPAGTDEDSIRNMIKLLESDGVEAKIINNYICYLFLGGNIVIDNNAGNNLVGTLPFGICTGNDAPQKGMKVGVTLLSGEDKSTTGRITVNGATDDVKYFTSDNEFYQVNYDSSGFLKLNYIISAVSVNTADITLENDEQTDTQAIAIATDRMPNSGLTKDTVVAYAKASDYATTGKYLTIKANASSDWQSGDSMTLAEMEQDLADNSETKAYFVIGLTGKTSVAAPTIYSKTYTGETLTADIDCSDKPYTVKTNNGGVSVGDYDVVLTLSDTTNYKWLDSDDADKTLTFSITQATNSWTTEPDIEDTVYGETLSVEGTSEFGDVEIAYAGTGNTEYDSTEAPVNVGTYKATFTVEETDNYTGLTKEVEFRIDRAPQTVPAPVAAAKTATSITLKEQSGQGATKYGYNTENSVPETWQDSTLFEGLLPRTTYYFFVKYEGNENYEEGISKVSAIATVVCMYGDKLTAGEEAQTLLLDDMEAGMYIISGNTRNGFSIMNTDGTYIAYDNGSIITDSTTAYIWEYDGGLFAEVRTAANNRHRDWFSWWNGRRNNYTITKYYLSYDGEKFVIADSAVCAEVQVIAADHTYTYVDNGDTHEAICIKCGHHEDPCEHDYTYDEINHKCICGKIDPAECYVKNVTVSEKQVKDDCGWWVPKHRRTTSYEYRINIEAQNVKINSVKYSEDNKNWRKGIKLTSRSKISVFYIQITDSNGNVTNWKYENGVVQNIGLQG